MIVEVGNEKFVISEVMHLYFAQERNLAMLVRCQHRYKLHLTLHGHYPWVNKRMGKSNTL
jgi:hypothetical protein